MKFDIVIVAIIMALLVGFVLVNNLDKGEPKVKIPFDFRPLKASAPIDSNTSITTDSFCLIAYKDFPQMSALTHNGKRIGVIRRNTETGEICVSTTFGSYLHTQRSLPDSTGVRQAGNGVYSVNMTEEDYIAWICSRIFPSL
jgi:hypothetical protein